MDAAGHLLIAWRGVELRDAGPLPRHSAWPPSLFAVFLERAARDAGLDESLRVSVSCGQPDGAGAGLLAAPVAAAPAEPGTAPAGPDTAPAGRYFAADPRSVAGFGLSVSAAVPVACAWSVIDAGHRYEQPPAAIAAIYTQLREQVDESPVQLAARLRAISACLATANGSGPECQWAAATSGDGWVVLQGGAVTVACTLAEVSGVPGRIAVAIATSRAAPPAQIAYPGRYVEAAAHAQRGT